VEAGRVAKIRNLDTPIVATVDARLHRFLSQSTVFPKANGVAMC
jgi:hypothetical protein